VVVVDVQGNAVGDTSGGDVLELPGFVNAHSHAFQRALRGRVEHRIGAGAAAAGDDFWSWRSTMYQDAARVTVDDVYALARWAYADMLRAGFVAVGEFHYLHHDVGAKPFASPEMSLALARAAKDVGIKLVLLETAYARGGANKPLSDEQRRFAFADVDAFLAHVERSKKLVEPLGASVGVAVHSVRACPRPFIERIATFAREKNMPLHIHACEQQKELEECRWEHGMAPVALLAECKALGHNTTLVHATHIEPDDVERIRASSTLVCLTPSTERNLGDGLCPISSLAKAWVRICIGTDSHARIDAVDELRSLEEHERLRTEKRNVLVLPNTRLAQALVPRGTWAGMQSLLLRADTGDRVRFAMPIEGRAGDVAAGLDALFVGGSSKDVVDVTVAGKDVVKAGKLVTADERDIEDHALAVLKRLR
jgi:formimidoylglutamate deiminase